MASEVKVDGELIFGVDAAATKTNFINGIKKIIESIEKTDATKITLDIGLSKVNSQLKSLKKNLESVDVQLSEDSLAKIQEQFQKIITNGISQGAKEASKKKTSGSSVGSSNTNTGSSTKKTSNSGGSSSGQTQNDFNKYATQVNNLFKAYEKTSALNEEKIRKIWMPVDRKELQLYSSALNDYYQQYKKNGEDIGKFTEDELKYILEIDKTFKYQLENHKNTTTQLGEETGLSWQKVSTQLASEINTIEKYAQKFPESAEKVEVFIEALRGLQTLTSERGEQTPLEIGDQLKYIRGEFESFKTEDAKLRKIEKEAEKAAKRLEKIPAEFTSIEKQAKAAGSTISTFFKKAVYFSIIQQVTMFVSQQLRLTLDYVVQIDDALTQIAIVTERNIDDLGEFTKRAGAIATDVGSSVTSIIKSSEVWARLGFSLEDATELAKATAIYSNVAATDTEAATDALTSILKGFDLEVSEITNIVDVLTKVGANYAISAEGLGEALQRGGAALYAGGNSLEEAVAILAAGNAAVDKIAA